MIKAVTESIKDHDGKVSTTRFCTYAITITVLATYIAHNVISIIKGGTYVDFPLNSVIVLGIVLTGKVSQQFVERNGHGRDTKSIG